MRARPSPSPSPCPPRALPQATTIPTILRVRPSRLAPFAHPAWWAALAVLLVNDNLLKGSGLVPGWLTGKLSDFAFLVVAPIVLAALVPARLPRRRELSLIAIVGVYAAADLSPAFSDGVVALAARFGLHWRLWPDPTDLLALAILPLTVRLLYREAAGAKDVGRLLRQRAGVILGAGACLATSSLPSYTHTPFLLNGTAAPETVKITWVLRALPSTGVCPSPESVIPTLNPADLDDPRTLSLASGQVAALDGPPPPGVSPVGTCASHDDSGYGDCVAAIVEAPATPPILMVTLERWWESSNDGGPLISCSSPPPPVSLCNPTLDPARDPGPDGLTIRELNGRRHFVAGARIAIAPIDPAVIAARTPSANGCRSLRETFRNVAAASTCTVDADCTTQPGLGILDDPNACGVYVSTQQTTELDDLRRKWTTGCLDEAPSCRTPLQPAVCRNGTCQPVCPGVELPVCPARCDRVPTSGRKCGGYYPLGCRLNDGSLCTCGPEPDAIMMCAKPDTVASNCPLACVDSPGGGTYRADGGTTSDGGTIGDGGSAGDGSSTGDGDAAGDGAASGDGGTDAGDAS